MKIKITHGKCEGEHLTESNHPDCHWLLAATESGMTVKIPVLANMKADIPN